MVTTTRAAPSCPRSDRVRIRFVDSRSFAAGLTSQGEFVVPPKELQSVWLSDELRAEHVVTAADAKGRASIRLECRGILVGVTEFLVL